MADVPRDLKSALAELKELLGAVVVDDLKGESLLRLSVEVEAYDPLLWLASQTPFHREGVVYWRSRDRQLEMAGISAAGKVHDLQEITTAHGVFDCKVISNPETGAAPQVRLLGAMEFDSGRSTDSNDNWGCLERPGVFVLPQFELCHEAGRTWLICNVAIDVPNGEEQLAQTVRRVGSLLPTFHIPDETGPTLVERADNPNRDGWARNISTLKTHFDKGRVDKVVLAREVALRLDRPLDPFALMYRLRKRNRDHHLFMFQPGPDSVFIGASPETLYQRKGRNIETESLAGTRPRGSNEAEDHRLGDELLKSEKDNREHRYVSDMIEDSLSPLCARLERDPAPSLRRLPHVQHLSTEFRGTLNEKTSDGDLLTALHPTPAVCGHPREDAMKVLRELEEFNRGLYAGPIGWVAADAAEFSVGIRSGLVRGSSLTIYSGAGIVRGSDHEQEWDEIEQKTAGFFEALKNS